MVLNTLEKTEGKNGQNCGRDKFETHAVSML